MVNPVLITADITLGSPYPHETDDPELLDHRVQGDCLARRVNEKEMTGFLSNVFCDSCFSEDSAHCVLYILLMQKTVYISRVFIQCSGIFIFKNAQITIG